MSCLQPRLPTAVDVQQTPSFLRVKSGLRKIAFISCGTTTAGGKFFRLEKYISINGEKHAPDDAIAILKAGDPSKNVSDVFPG